MLSRRITAPWLLVPTLTAVLAVALALPAAAIPQFCFCWCTAEPSSTACTIIDLNTRQYVFITCGEWLSQNAGECNDPGPYPLPLGVGAVTAPAPGAAVSAAGPEPVPAVEPAPRCPTVLR